MSLSVSKKILILTYYWPPSGGSGVQRWMYFAKYLKELGWEPIVITLDEKQAAYPQLDHSLLKEVEGVRVIRTKTREPLRLYARLFNRSQANGIPQGEVNTKSFFGRLAAYIRGNYFIPDARKGWVPYAVKAAQKLLKEEKIEHLITTGPPHSTHLAGLQLSAFFQLNWWADLRDPWSDIFYNKQMRRSQRSQAKDAQYEKTVLQKASGVITTIGGDFQHNLRLKAPQQRFITLANGYDAKLMQRIVASPPKDAFHIVYTGLLTQHQAYPAIIEALHQLKGERSIRFSLAGNIPKSILKEIQTALPHIEVIYHGYLDHAAAVSLMKKAHLLLNFIFAGATTQMISGKLLEYFETQVPVLSLGDPHTAAGTFIAQGTCAKMIKSEDKAGIFTFIKALYEADTTPINKMENLSEWSRKSITKSLIKKVLS